MSSTIQAALVSSSQDKHLVESGEIPFPQITDDEILIKAVAFAANPTDWKHIALKIAKPGDISGTDVSGIVFHVGKNVKGFAEGDIVSTFIRGGVSPEKGGFAEYVRASPVSTIKYAGPFEKGPLTPSKEYPAGPIDSYEGAASVTLGLVTVTLSFAHSLKLKADSSKAILIWSGATATGILAIQLAKLLFGLKVITTASPKHHDFLKSLGADAVYDYKDPEVVSKIRKYAQGSIAYGFDTISEEATFQALYDATEGSENVALDNLLGLDGSSIKTKPGRHVSFGKTLAYLVFGKSVSMGAEFKFTPEILDEYNQLWPKVLEVVPQLKHHKLKVLQPGFTSASEALNLLQLGKVSGEKIVWRAQI